MVGISKEQRAALAAVRERFERVDLTDEQDHTIENVTKQFVKLAGELQRVLPDGRNKSLALTALEDAAMRSTRAISHDTPREEEPEEEAEQPAAVVQEEAPKKARRVPRRRQQPAEEVAGQTAIDDAPDPAA